MLEQLEREHLFVSRTGSPDDSFRYHELFREKDFRVAMSHAKSCACDHSGLAENMQMKLRARGADPVRNQGRRRPQRLRVRSEM